VATPTIVVTFDFSSGATFGYPFIIGEGVLGFNTLANAAADVIDISDQVNNVSIKRGYNLLQEQFQAGTATIRILDPNGDWNPTNTASPYYGKLVPLRKVRISADGYFLFSGYTTAYNYTWDKEQNIGYVDIDLVDAFRLLNMSNITTVTGAAAGDTTGNRITYILNTIGFPTSMRTIAAGATTVQADPGTSRTSLQAIQNMEFSEQGAFFINPSGNAEFLSRLSIEQKSGVNPTFFSNDGTGITYRNIVTALDDKLIINTTSINRAGGTAQTASNTASQIKYFPHSFTATDLLVQTDAQSLDIARAYTATRAETTLRVDSLTLDLNTPSYTAGTTAALSLDFFDTIRVKNVGQDGTIIDKTLQCMGVAHEITPATWNTTFVTSEPIIDSFIIGSSLYGIIGTSVMTY
tara:strand:- start:3547 stop:4770 length:1224 start_codon:yes stop_codon:yes gene_type:complete